MKPAFVDQRYLFDVAGKVTLTVTTNTSSGERCFLLSGDNMLAPLIFREDEWKTFVELAVAVLESSR